MFLPEPPPPDQPDLPADQPIPSVPRWYPNHECAREQFGDLVDRLGPYLMQGDRLADALAVQIKRLPAGEGKRLFLRALESGIESVPEAPTALLEFFNDIDQVPTWVDWDRVARGGALILRSGPIGALVLMCYSLPLSYRSPDGNKPLVFSRRLLERAHRRLSETARFVVEVARPDGLRRFSEGFKAAAKVRLLHAHTRRLLLRSDYWSLSQWGMPINQVYLAATNIMFAGVFFRGLRKLGMPLSDSDGEDLVHLWRYVGKLMGISAPLVASTVAEGDFVHSLIDAVIPPPDTDSIALTQALMQTPQTMARGPLQKAAGKLAVPFVYAVSRFLVGDHTADALGYPVPSPLWRNSVPALRALLSTATLGHQLAPPAVLSPFEALFDRAGTLAWEGMIAYGLRGLPATKPAGGY